KIPHSWGFTDKEETKEAAEASVRAIPDSAASHGGNAGPQPITSMRIEFPSADSVHKAGIQVATVQVRSIAQYVTANGAADYEPSRYARLTSRATGTIWRMEKETGDSIRKGEILALIDAAEVGRAKADFLHSLTQVRLRAAT